MIPEYLRDEDFGTLYTGPDKFMEKAKAIISPRCKSLPED
jgi:hypothetical protein